MNFTERLLLEAVYRHNKKQVTEDELKSRKLKEASIAALKEIRAKSSQYGQNFILYSLILGIAEKKSRMICQAETISQIKEILKPSAPYWNGGEFRPGPYLVPEEELLMWSELSLEAVLNGAGYKRFEKVFTELFPEKAEEIFGKKVA